MFSSDSKPESFQIQVPLIISVIVGAVSLVIVLLAFILRADLRTAQELTEVKVGYLTRLVGARAEATMLQTESMLTDLHDTLTILDPWAIGIRKDLITGHLQKLLKEKPYFLSLSVLNREAEPVYHSDGSPPPGPANLSDIQMHIRSVDSGFLIGALTRSEADGKWVMPVSLPSRTSDGRVQRIVVAMIDLALFSKQFENLTLSPFDSIAVLTESRQVLLRIPHIDVIIGRYLNDPILVQTQSSCYSRTDVSMLTITSPFDGSERSFTCHKVPNYGLLASASVTNDSIHRSVEIKIALTVLGCLLVTASGFLAARRLVRNHGDLARQRHRMEHLASTDMLTGLPNRFHFLSRAQQTLALATRYNDTVSCFVLDVDHFKRINDRFGHDAGDRALRKLGEVIENVIRDCDLPCRFGGEEFAILLPRTDLEGALSVAERLLAEIRAANLQFKDMAYNMTASIGISVRHPNETVNVDTLIKRADEALYRSKHNGRDRIEIWSPPPPTEASPPRTSAGNEV